jgi:hypothetical protein
LPKHDICPLCEKYKELQKSHIIPSSAHTITKVAGKNVLMGVRKGEFKAKNQKDYAEDLLCFDCEQILSVIEGDAIKACKAAWPSRTRRRYKIPAHSIRPLVAFVYSVFWRASKAKCVDTYNIDNDLEKRLTDAFWNCNFPDSQELSVSISFLKILNIDQSQNLLLAPMYALIPGSATAHYFSAFGLLFRMFSPGGIFEIESGEFLDVKEERGYIFQLPEWEKELFDSTLARSAVLAIQEGATPSA